VKATPKTLPSEQFENALAEIAHRENVSINDPRVRRVWLRFIREFVAPRAFKAGDRHRAEQYIEEEWLLNLRD